MSTALPAPAPLRLGLTGGIGSGKSTVAALLRQHGAALIDADAIAQACTQSGGSAMAAIVQTFGADFAAADGSLLRPRMREHVFAQPQERQRLEAIIHPLVHAEMARQAAAATARCLVFDLPLLVESPHWRARLDWVLVLDCSVPTQRRRVHARSGWSPASIEAAIKSQCPRAQRLAAADVVLYNEHDQIDPLQALVAELARQFGL